MIRLESSFLPRPRSTVVARLSASLLAASFIVPLATLTACGGAGEARSPSRVEEPEATSVEEAQRRIDAAKAELATASSKTPETADSTASPPGSLGAQPGAQLSESAPADQSKQSSTEFGGASTPDTASERCANPCRAIASMRRAVTALCRMTGAEDTRCQGAMRTLADSEGRVTACAC